MTTASFRPILAATIVTSLMAGVAFAQTPAPVAVPSGPQASSATPLGPATQPKAPPIPDPHWLSPEEIKAIVTSDPPPPAPGSPADRADLQTEIDVQNSRTPERSAQARKDSSFDVSLFLKDVNPALNAKNDPKLYFFLRQIHRYEIVVMNSGKGRFRRPRPFVAHPDVIHPLGTIGGSSYPSGHALIAFCNAVVLGRIFPGDAALFLDDAKRVAQSRVVMGVHYPTDIREGEREGREIARELLTKPDFLARLAEVESEVGQQP